MKQKLIFIFSGIIFLVLNCNKTTNQEVKSSLKSNTNGDDQITFVEIGSVKCIPCQMMKPIIDDIEKEYTGKVKVVFHDVWTPEGKEKAQKYKFRVIPTQVFLDKEGKEYYRHEGFFSKNELVEVLKRKL